MTAGMQELLHADCHIPAHLAGSWTGGGALLHDIALVMLKCLPSMV